MPPAQLRNCGRHFFCLSFPSRHPCLPFPRGRKSLFHKLETTVSCTWNNCFMRLKQLFHTLETVGTLDFATGISWFKTDYTLLQTLRFPLLLWSMANNKIGSINQHQWEVGFLFFLGWIRASLAIGFALHSVTQSATQLNGKQNLRHNATNTLQADYIEPTWYLNGIRSCCANEKAAKLMVRIVDKREA